jgi:cobalt-zinc-cadmium efflux system membrane fusion protein
VQLADKVIRDAGIRTELARKEPLATTLALPGEVAVDPDKSARIASPVAGLLTKVSFNEGSVVQKGAVLALVRIPDLARLRSSHAGAAARATTARTNATRLGELERKGLASQQEFANARAEADALEAETRALDQQLRALGTAPNTNGSDLALRAPIAGVVVSRSAVVGQPVTADEVIASIADLGAVWFLGRVFEKDLDDVRLNARAEVQLNAFPKRRFQGTVEYVGRQIDPIARTLTARIRLVNQDDVLRIGLFGVAHVAVGDPKREPVLVVPRNAVVEVNRKPVVFVRQPDGAFELHDVVLGQSSLGKVEVVSGLREGEPVVVEGAFTLKSSVLRGSLAEDE